MGKYISVENKKLIISKLNSYRYDKSELNNLAEDVAGDIVGVPDVTGVHASGAGDPTSRKAALIESKRKKLQPWVDVVDNVLYNFGSDDKAKKRFAKMYCIEHKQQYEIMNDAKIMISQSTYYNWRSELIEQTFIEAVMKGLIKR